MATQGSVSFDDITAKPEYQAAPSAVQRDVALRYFNDHYASKKEYKAAAPEVQQDAQRRFFSDYKVPELKGNTGQFVKLGNQTGPVKTNFIGDVGSHFTNSVTGFSQDDLVRNSGHGVGATIGDIAGSIATISAGSAAGSALGTVVPVIGNVAGGIGGGVLTAGAMGTAQDLQQQRLKGAENPNFGRALGSGTLQGALQSIPVIGQARKFLPRAGINAAIQGTGAGIGSIIQQGVEQGDFTPEIDWNRVKAESALGTAGGAVSGAMHKGKVTAKDKVKSKTQVIDDPDIGLQQYEAQQRQQAIQSYLDAQEAQFNQTMAKKGLNPDSVNRTQASALNKQYTELGPILAEPSIPPKVRAYLEGLRYRISQAHKQLKPQSSSELQQALKGVIRETAPVKKSKKAETIGPKRNPDIYDNMAKRAKEKQPRKKVSKEDLKRSVKQGKVTLKKKVELQKPKNLKVKKGEATELKAALREAATELTKDRPAKTKRIIRSDARRPDIYDKMAEQIKNRKSNVKPKKETVTPKPKEKTQPTGPVAEPKKVEGGTKAPTGKAGKRVTSRQAIKAEVKQAFKTGEVVEFNYSAEGGRGQAIENAKVKQGRVRDGRTEAKKIGGEDLDKQHAIRRETVIEEPFITNAGDTAFRTITEAGDGVRTRIIEGKGQKSRVNWFKRTGEASPFKMVDNQIVRAETGQTIEGKAVIEAEHTSVVEAKLQDIVKRVNAGEKVNSREIINVTKEAKPNQILDGLDKMDNTAKKHQKTTKKVDC